MPTSAEKLVSEAVNSAKKELSLDNDPDLSSRTKWLIKQNSDSVTVRKLGKNKYTFFVFGWTTPRTCTAEQVEEYVSTNTENSEVPEDPFTDEELDKVYRIYTMSEPDIDQAKLHNFGSAIKAALGKVSVMQASRAQLEAAFDKAGLTGPGGDQLRGPGDKYY